MPLSVQILLSVTLSAFQYECLERHSAFDKVDVSNVLKLFDVCPNSDDVEPHPLVFAAAPLPIKVSPRKIDWTVVLKVITTEVWTRPRL